MSKTALTKRANTNEATLSSASAAERQNLLGAHLCIQREASGLGVQPHAPSLVRDVLNSAGKPLDADTRTLMEPKFGYDFSGVRVHTDEKAAESARAVSAKAYTVGSHVAFGPGQYQPKSQSGEQILAHELTHVVQQAVSPVAGTDIGEGVSVSRPGDRFEQQASAVSDAFPRGAQSALAISAPPTLSLTTGVHNSLHVQRFTDTSPDAPYQQQQTSAAERSAGYGEASAIFGGVSAGAGIASAIIAGLAYGVSKDQLAEARKQNVIAQEALETSEGQATTVEGLTVTHAAVPDLHPDEKSTKRASLTVPILKMGVGAEDSAQYRLRLQVDEKGQIRGGNTEEEDAQGYPGGFSGSNANITFSTSQVSANPDSLLVQFRGTNVAAKRRGAQRIHGELTVSAPKWDSQIKAAPKGPTTPGKGPWALIPPDRKPTFENQPPPPEKQSGGKPTPTKKGAKK